MAFWDSTQQRIVYFSPKSVDGYPDWQEIDCGCCAGIEWGGEEPRECNDCGGRGTLYFHLPSRVLADYPGGPLRGKR